MSSLYSNEKSDGQLSNPGECVVVRVGQNSIQLQVSIYDDQHSNPDVEFKIDTIYQQKAIVSKPIQTKMPTNQKKLESIDDLKREIAKAKEKQTLKEKILPMALSGHVELKGNVEKKAGKWLGGVKGSKRIEAFSINWPGKPKGVNLKYSCSVKHLGTFPSVKSGEMVGTVQRALPITAIQVGISGKKAAGYTIKVQASFSESGVQQRIGIDEEIKALHSDEFLTGIKVDVIKMSAPPMLPGKASKKGKAKKVDKNKKMTNWNDFDDVMVFRSK